MGDLEDLSEKVTHLESKVQRLEFAMFFVTIIMFLLFNLCIYLRR